MANQYDTNLKLQAIADAIGDTSSSGLISALEDIADAVAGGGGGGGSSTAGLVSDNFSETDTYDLGDYCIHNNTLYVCINAITTPGPWDLSDWQATNTGIQLSSLNSALQQTLEKISPLLFNNAGAHNAIYRGKNLGTAFTAAQSAAIRDGSFKDLYIGDYWTINGTVYRIADFDYFLKSGDTECTAHHAVIVPDVSIDNQKMNDTNVTTGAYIGSKMYTTNMATAKAKIKADFGSTHILAHREYLANAVAKGKQSAGTWYDSEIELMTESMVYGAPHFAPACDGSTIPTNYTIGCKQLNLFRHRPDRISNRQNYWLRDVVSAADFANVGSGGFCSYANASGAYGVRPAFCIS